MPRGEEHALQARNKRALFETASAAEVSFYASCPANKKAAEKFDLRSPVSGHDFTRRAGRKNSFCRIFA
jgi:hypothetical protein